MFRRDRLPPVVETAQPPELIARRTAYASMAAAYAADPLQSMYLDLIRRDTDIAHQYLKKVEEQEALDRAREVA